VTTVEELSCQELVELVTDYLEGALDAEARARFEAHLDSCSGCRNYVEQMRTTISLVGRLSPETLPEGAKEALLRAFRSWKAPGDTSP